MSGGLLFRRFGAETTKRLVTGPGAARLIEAHRPGVTGRSPGAEGPATAQAALGSKGMPDGLAFSR